MRQLGQRSGKNGFIASPIVRWSKGAADRMIDERCARRCDPAHESSAVPITMVGIPAASITWAMRPTVSWQKGQ